MNRAVTLTSVLIIDDDPAFQMILQTKLEVLLGKPIIMLSSSLKEAREVVKSNRWKKFHDCNSKLVTNYSIANI